MKSLVSRVLSILLCLIFMIGMVARTSIAQDIVSAELELAIELGFGDAEQTDRSATYAQFAAILDRFMELANPSVLLEWKTKLSGFRNSELSNEPIYRAHAFFALYGAALFAGEGYYEQSPEDMIWNDRIGDPWASLNIPNWEIFGDDFSNEMVKDTDWDILPSAYFYTLGKKSLTSGKWIFEYDAESNSMRGGDFLTYEEAMLAALRIHHAKLDTKPRAMTEADKIIQDAANARRDSILSSPTKVEITGRSFYVSNLGDDNNDGRSPQTAWETLDKVNSAVVATFEEFDSRANHERFPQYLWAYANPDNRAVLRAGDGVFFERGGEWRGTLNAVAGVTYSAYGEGAKPRLLASPEDAAYPEA